MKLDLDGQLEFLAGGYKSTKRDALEGVSCFLVNTTSKTALKNSGAKVFFDLIGIPKAACRQMFDSLTTEEKIRICILIQNSKIAHFGHAYISRDFSIPEYAEDVVLDFIEHNELIKEYSIS